MKINSNINAHITANALSKNQRAMGNAMERLSTGVRINSARDDAAGLAITSKMTSQINGLKQAVRNTNDAISMLQVAEGATQDVVDMLQRLRELAVQAASGSNTAADKATLQKEANQVIAGIDKIATQTQWNGVNLLDGSMSGKFQVGGNSNQTIDFTFNDLQTSNFALGNSTWMQRGGDIPGEAAGDGSGRNVSISADGKTVAIGTPDNDGNGLSSGHVRIFDYNGSEWIQRGLDIDGKTHLTYLGGGNGNVVLSLDGNTVAVGAHSDLGGVISPHGVGVVRLYDWDGASWVQRGMDINGEHGGTGNPSHAGQNSGWSVDLSADTNTIIIGDPKNVGQGAWAGHARIFD